MTDITSWAMLRCIGPRKNDPYNSCGRTIAQVDLVPSSRVRVRCHACGFYTEAVVVLHMGSPMLSYVKPTVTDQPIVIAQQASYATVASFATASR